MWQCKLPGESEKVDIHYKLCLAWFYPKFSSARAKKSDLPATRERL